MEGTATARKRGLLTKRLTLPPLRDISHKASLKRRCLIQIVRGVSSGLLVESSGVLMEFSSAPSFLRDLRVEMMLSSFLIFLSRYSKRVLIWLSECVLTSGGLGPGDGGWSV